MGPRYHSPVYVGAREASQPRTICRYSRRIEVENLLRRECSFGRAIDAMGAGHAAPCRNQTRYRPVIVIWAAAGDTTTDLWQIRSSD